MYEKLYPYQAPYTNGIIISKVIFYYTIINIFKNIYNQSHLSINFSTEGINFNSKYFQKNGHVVVKS